MSSVTSATLLAPQAVAEGGQVGTILRVTLAGFSDICPDVSGQVSDRDRVLGFLAVTKGGQQATKNPKPER